MKCLTMSAKLKYDGEFGAVDNAQGDSELVRLSEALKASTLSEALKASTLSKALKASTLSEDLAVTLFSAVSFGR